MKSIPALLLAACHLALLTLVYQTAAESDPSADPPLTDCLKECLSPMVKMERTISYMFRNYEKVCDKLEKSANCVQTCSPEDRQLFFQYTTFYRIHCVEMEEVLEDHIDCIKEASYKADVVCRGICAGGEKAEKKTLPKEEQRKQVCKSVECSTLCYFKEFIAKCPTAKDPLMQVNMRNADEMKRLIRPDSLENMAAPCQRIHDSDYMRRRMLEQLKK